MVNYTKWNLYCFSLSISVCICIGIFSVMPVLANRIQNTNPIEEAKKIKENLIQKEEEIIQTKTIQHDTKDVQTQEKIDIDAIIHETRQSNNGWEIRIPKIQLIAPIEEGTTKEVMNRAVGHFESSHITNGNICLAAHNRGYPVNYFENIKSLQQKDDIIYKIVDEVRVYKVDFITVIKDTDWTYLQDTQENKITLITCVENEPEYRRCIQATQVK